MEQINFLNYDDPEWVVYIKKTIAKKAADEKLPDESLILTVNKTKDGKDVSSYSVVVRRPDYPKGVNSGGISSSSIMNIKENNIKGKRIIEIPVTDKIAKKINSQYQTISVITGKADNSITKIRIEIDDPMLQEIIETLIDIEFEDYISSGVGQTFGCCHLYKECSDAKECLHDNKLYAKGCKYYQSLRKGIIFYGDNRNID